MAVTLLDNGAEKRHIFHDDTAHPDVRESMAFLLPLPELQLGVIFYSWVHALGESGLARAGSAGIVFGSGVASTVFEVHDDIGVPDDLAFDDWQVGPGRMVISDDMMQGSITFAGDRVAFAYDWTGLNPSFGFADNHNGCPQWLAWDRAEQGMYALGALTVEGRTYPLDTFGHRDHSWGMRDWGGATHWKWWNLMAPGGIAIHVMELQYFGRTTVHGYVQKDGVMATALELDADLTFDERFMHTEVAATILDDAGRTTRVTGRQGGDLQWPVSPRLWLHEAAMYVTVDGIDGVGYIECAWPPEYVAHHRTDGGVEQSADLTLDRD